MARGEVDLPRGVKCFSYRRITTGFCCVNLILALFVLRSLNSTSSVSLESSTGVRFSDEQIKRLEESIRIRKAFEPVELARLVKRLKKASKSRNSKPVELNLAYEILSRLKGLDNSTEWRGALESWRVEKLEEIRSLSLADTSANLSTPLKVAKKLKKALETDWQMLLESIGFWMPSEITHIVVDDKPDNVEELGGVLHQANCFVLLI
ncbi:hypothetical protein AXF42_Ash015595 [Apostasia shenzhenica]|uniref:Uncharacterized protein n=1 Tax=Apostasia shenzhenica TaxID=1088818 RepID=A0A2I0AKN6_9ASPA|nr:hypothetical protein AXF42_Ash015595 [Apostasia shenzhenica]